MKDPYHFGGIRAVWKALWGAPITEVREVNDDAQSKAASNNQFIAGHGVADQASARVLRGTVGALYAVGLWLLYVIFVIGKVGEAQVHLI